MRPNARRLLVAFVFVVLGIAFVSGDRIVSAATRTSHWRQADRTADRFLRATAARDSVRIAAVAASGSGHNVGCAFRFWPSHYWRLDSTTPPKRWRHTTDGYEYQIDGAPFPGTGIAATTFFIIRDTDRAHVHMFGMLNGEPSDSFWACAGR